MGEAENGDRFDVTNPATGEVVGSVPNGTAEDVQAAIDAAAAAFDGVERDRRRSSARASCAAPPT